MNVSEIKRAIHEAYDNVVASQSSAETMKSLVARVAESLKCFAPLLEYKIVCDSTNNPPSVAEAGGLGLDVFFYTVERSYHWSSRTFGNIPEPKPKTSPNV